jgi:hypothetical protein
MNAAGALAFARYAYPPNTLGYCGPDDHRALLEHAAAGVAGPGLARLARGFDGAWPYLELIAGANGVRDPLDARVVEAYWIGNPLLERVGMAALGAALVERFRGRAGRGFARLAEAVPAGAVPHHSLHVFGVYPWVGLLRAGSVEHPLRVLDRCRVRWGEVVAVTGGMVTVRSRPLTWDGRSLRLGAPTLEQAVGARDGLALAGELRPGDRVALHWDWVCDRLTTRQLGALRHYTARQLAIVNGLAHPAPAAVLG